MVWLGIAEDGGRWWETVGTGGDAVQRVEQGMSEMEVRIEDRWSAMVRVMVKILYR